ncbi:MAG: hypothetical protein QOD46_397, partial [Actinomycetota bacterium]|nr:hypothetical protein [Actinomycetota bacterium]
ERLSTLRAELAAMAQLDCPATTESDLWPCQVQFREKGGDR